MIARVHFQRHRRLAWACGILAGFLLVVILFAMFFPMTFLGSFLGDEGSRRLSREFSIDGPVNISWSWPAPRVHMEKIRLANMPDSEDPDMLTIAAADIRIRIPSLLIGRLDLPEVRIDRPRLVLEKRDQDHKNWDFPALSGGGKVAAATVPNSRHHFPMIGRLRIRDGALLYRDKTKDMEVELQLDTGQARGTEDDADFRVTGHGTLQKKKFELHARGGSLQMLRDSGKDYPLDLAVTMGATKLALQGTFRDPIKIRGIDSTLNLSGNNMADLFYLTGIPLPPTPPYKLAGALGKEGKIWSFKEFKGKVGDSDLSGSAVYDLTGEKGFLKADLASHVLDMDDMGGFIGLNPGTGPGETASPKQKAQAKEKEAEAHVFPDVPINLDRLRSTNMDVTLAADTLHAPGWPLKGGKVRFDLKDGLLKLDPLELVLADGTVGGDVVLDGRKDVPDVHMNLDIRRLSLDRFFDKTRFDGMSAGHFGGHIDLSGQGRSLASVLGSSDGRTVFLMSGGQISLLLIEATDIDISEAAPLLLGDDKSTAIRCGVADFKVTDGLLRSQAVVLDTEDTNLEGKAVVNLRNETLDATLKAHAKDKSLFAGQVPVRVTGTIKHPAVGIEPVEASARGAAAVALGVVLTPLAAVIPFIEPGLGKDSDCGALLATAEAHATEPAAGGP